MSGFKQPDLVERQKAAAEAKKAALEKFRAKTADPALAERLTTRAASAADRRAAKNVREIEKAQSKARDAERAQQVERRPPRGCAGRGRTRRRELAVQAEQKVARDARYAARKARSKR